MKSCDIQKAWLNHRENCECKFWYDCPNCDLLFESWAIAIMQEYGGLKPTQDKKFIYMNRYVLTLEDIFEAMTIDDLNFLVIYKGDAFWFNTDRDDPEMKAISEFQKQIIEGIK